MATLLEKIAAEVSPQLGGVDWTALEARLGIPREEIVYHTGVSGDPSTGGLFMYLDYIEKAYDRANASLAQVRLTWQIEDNPETSESEIELSMEAWESAKGETVAIGDAVLHALRSKIELLSRSDEFVMDKELLRAMISSAYMTALYGAVAHAKAMMQLSDVAPEDIVASADGIVKMFNALSKLADMGVLDPLKDTATRPTTVEGRQIVSEEVVQATGAVPVAVVVAIAAVLAVGIIAWCIVEVIRQQAINRVIGLVCQDAVSRGEEEALERCKELVKLNKTAQNGGPLGDLAITLGQAALMVGVGYALFLIIPPISRMLDKKAVTA